MTKRLLVRNSLLAAVCVVSTVLFPAAHPTLAQSPGQTDAKPRGPSHPAAAAADAAGTDELLAKAQSAMNDKDFAAAAAAYSAYVAKNPDDAVAHFQLGYAYTALRKMDDARAEYQRATELNPNMGEAFLNLGLIQLSRDAASAIAPLQKAAALMPDDAHPLAALGAALEHSGKTDDAIVQYKAAEALDDQSFSVHFALGNVLLRAGRAADAEPEFRAAVALDAADPQGHLGLGECLIAERQFAAGAAELATYLKAHPGDAKTSLIRASALIDASQYDDALTELDRSDTGAPETLPSLKLRFEALSALKRSDDATAVLIKAASLAPSDVEVRTKLGQAYLEEKNYAAAAAEFQAVLKLTPTDKQVMAALVAVDYSANNCANALQVIGMQEQQTPLPLGSLFIRAGCYDKLGKKAEALDAYQAFLSANKDLSSDMYFAAAERARDLRRELGNKK